MTLSKALNKAGIKRGAYASMYANGGGGGAYARHKSSNAGSLSVSTCALNVQEGTRLRLAMQQVSRQAQSLEISRHECTLQVSLRELMQALAGEQCEQAGQEQRNALSYALEEFVSLALACLCDGASREVRAHSAIAHSLARICRAT